MKKLLSILFVSLGISGVLYLWVAYPEEYSNLFNQLSSFVTNHTDENTTSAVTEKMDAATAQIKTAAEKLEPLTEPIKELKANYMPMDGSGELVDDSKDKDSILNAPASNTGEAYSFDAVFYPYYYMLNENQQSVYKQVYANALALNSSAFSPYVTLSNNEVDDIMSAVYNDHPELFWLDTKYSYSYTPQGSVKAIALVFNDTASNIETAQANFDSAANTIITNASSLSSDLEKEKYVNDYLMDLVSYNEASEMNQSAYSALVNTSSVCAGYARAFQYLMIKLGTPCYYCTGTANGENHAWNIIKLGDAYYNLDTSWNDSLGTVYNKYCYTYFNLPDSEFSSDHTRTGLSINLPACTGTAMTYANTYGNGESDTTGSTRYATYESLGYSDNDIIQNLSDYYAQCASLLTQAGTGEHTFTFILQDESLLQDIYSETQSQEYVDAYIKTVAANLGLSSCNVSIKLQADQLADGYILLQQSIYLDGNTQPTANPSPDGSIPNIPPVDNIPPDVPQAP